MKKKKLLFILISLFLTANTTAFAAKPKAKHVILIGLDGWGSYSVEKADMPVTKQFMAEGAYTLKKRSVLPSSSAVNWASMFMGAGPEVHGYTEWGSKKPELPSRVVYKNNIFPTIFQLYRDADPKAEIGCLYEWDGIKYLVDTLSLNYHAQAPNYKKHPTALCEMSVKYIKEKKPNFMAVIFDNPDHVGHADGHDTPNYYTKLKELDGYISQIVDAVKQAGMYDDAIFIITADHGGVNKGHGGKTMLEMETPFIISGKSIKKKGYCFDDISMMQYDCASILAKILGVKQPQVWTGRLVKEIF
ncbi:alkaline phosphatase [Bacteroides sp. 224]|uniref:alkaline phosphatase n=1 Tax=Bacteroides sp. 224 TaxID=2302936 RepID=UPI0013D61B89|nr:alkaline phosphatase [Bacteroides sp. 224]NDV63660.1 alkaline phosphatase [Bacteroides sp. 224]